MVGKELAMTKEDSLHFVHERLRHHAPPPLTRTQRLKQRPRVTRRFAVELPQGDAQVFERVDETVQVHCASGSVWITHDGDCKDVILSPHQSYRAEREQPMHVFALQPCVLEIEFEDEVLPT
jgi:hypothetical protein